MIGEGTAWGLESLFRFANGVVLNDLNQRDCYRLEVIEGIQTDPELRSGDSQQNPNDHGEIPPGSSLYSGRSIILRGQIEAHNMVVVRAMQRALKQAISLSNSTLFIEPDPDYTHQNFARNPSGVVDLSFWANNYAPFLSGVGAQPLVRVAVDGEYEVRAQFDGGTNNQGVAQQLSHTLRAGITYRFSMTLRSNVALIGEVFAGTDDAAGDYVVKGVDLSPNVPQRVTMLWTPNEDQVNPVVGFRTSAGSATVAVKKMMVRPGSYGGGGLGYESDHGDGDSVGWNWIGEPHKSPSTAMVPVQIGYRKGAAIGLEEQQQGMKYARQFMLTLRCANPRLLSQTEKSLVLTPPNGTMLASGEIQQLGDFPAQAVVRFNGPTGQNPRLDNLTNGLSLKTRINGLAAGEWVEYQYAGSRRRVVDDDGFVRPSYFAPDSDWMALASGANDLEFVTTTGAVAPVNAVVTWRDTWI